MAREAVLRSEEPPEDRERDSALRPRWLRDVIGQKAVVQRLGISLNASRKLKEPLAHILFDGPPGLGKTTFATVLPNELGVALQMTSGPALTNPKDLVPYLTNAEEGSVLLLVNVPGVVAVPVQGTAVAPVTNGAEAFPAGVGVALMS